MNMGLPKSLQNSEFKKLNLNFIET